MSYRVVWEDDAESDLTQIWLNSRMRHAISDAADRMDAMLQQNPNQFGESRQANRRIMLLWPLGILFEVDDNNREVRVLSVWSY